MSSGGAALKTRKTGREQQRSSATAQARTPDLSRFYKYKRPEITPGNYAFHLDLLRPHLPPFSLDRMVDTFGWVDEQSILTGSLTAYRPDPETPASLPVTRGQLVRCTVDWGDSSYRLWTMRAEAPQTELDTGQIVLALKDDMALLDGPGRDWWFRKTKRRPYGYRADEIARQVAATLGVKVRKLAKGTVRMHLKMRNATGLAVLKKAYANERAHSGRSFVLRIRDGELEVVPLGRNPIAYVLAGQIQTALITQGAGQKIPTTVLTGRGHVGAGKHAKSLSYTEYDRRVVNLLGYSHDTVHLGRVDSAADLRGQVRRLLAKRLRFNSQVTISQQGIPFILRGDGCQVDLPHEGYSGANSWVFCTSATHTVQAGVYSTQWDFTYRDPYLAQLAADAKAAAARKTKSEERGLSTDLAGDRWKVVASAEDDPPGASGACRTIQADGYSELSTIPEGTSSDFAALGNIPCLTPMKITNPVTGRSVITVKQDKGAGSSFLPVLGLYPQTRSDLGLDNSGQYSVIIQRADGHGLTPVRGTRL